jgi:hypothetical protein
MPEMVGSTGATVGPWTGLIAAIGRPHGAPVRVAESAATDRDLAWQTTVGQIVFLESVVRKPT